MTAYFLYPSQKSVMFLVTSNCTVHYNQTQGSYYLYLLTTHTVKAFFNYVFLAGLVHFILGYNEHLKSLFQIYFAINFAGVLSLNKNMKISGCKFKTHEQKKDKLIV